LEWQESKINVKLSFWLFELAILKCLVMQQKYKKEGQFKSAKCIYCVHNIAFQGRFWPETMDGLNMPESSLDDFTFIDGFSKVYDEKNPLKEDYDSTKDLKGRHKKVNWMRAGFLTSDKNLTVSPNYATEVSSGPDKGVELDDIIRQTGIEGIVNGVPATHCLFHDHTHMISMEKRFLWPLSPGVGLEGMHCTFAVCAIAICFFFIYIKTDTVKIMWTSKHPTVVRQHPAVPSELVEYASLG
jgi:hypothetical protein